MINTNNRVNRIVYLDGLRGIAALAVAVMHFPLQNVITFNPLIENSYLFVDFFFVLSGFIIAKLYNESIDRKRFIKHRIARIAPVFYLTLLFGVILESLKFLLTSITTTEPFQGSNNVYALLREIMMIHALPFFNNSSFNPPNWSISAEFFAYFFFAAIMTASFKQRFIVWLIIFFSCFAYAPFVTDLSDAHNLALYRCFFGFSCGTLISMSNIEKVNFLNLNIFKFESFTLLATTLILFYIACGGFFLFPPALAFGLFLFLMIKSQTKFKKIIFENHLVIFLGEISLTVYLIHFFIAMRFDELKDLFFVGNIPNEILLLFYIALLLLLSLLINKYFEKPMRIFLR